jgi:hypothetical protein
MRLLIVQAFIAISWVTLGAYAVPDPEAGLNTLLSRAAADVLEQLQKEEISLAKRGIEASCTVKNIAIRREL